MVSRSALVTALAIATATVVAAPQARAVTLIGLTDDNTNTLVRFDSANPSSVSSVQVNNIDGNLLGIDRRPANNIIYGLTDTNKLYTINPITGAATFVSTLSVPFTGGALSGVDFNPVPDRLRVVGSNDQNFRINVDNGAVVVDGTLNPGNPNITAAAYTNVDNNPATGTALYDIDFVSDQLFLQNPPNNGTLVSRGSLGVDFGPTAGFDIFTDASGVNTGFAVSGSTLFNIDIPQDINTNTKGATVVGRIGNGTQTFRGLTTAVPEPGMGFGALIGGGALILLSSRRRYANSSKQAGGSCVGNSFIKPQLYW